MKVKVLKCKDMKGHPIATLEAFGGSVIVYAVKEYPNGAVIAGRGIYPCDSEEVTFSGYEDAAKLTTGELRARAMEAMLEMFPTLYLTDFRFGRVTTRDAGSYYSF